MNCKVSFGSTTVRIRLDESHLESLENLLAEVCRALQLPSTPAADQQQYRLKYFDDDNCEIDLLTTDGLKEAIRVVTFANMRCFNLSIHHTTAPFSAGAASVGRHQVTLPGGVIDEMLIRNKSSLPIAQSNHNHHPLTQTLLAEISHAHEQVAQEVIEWWLVNMPDAYFKEIDHETRMSHLRALIALQIAGQKLEIALMSADGCRYTVIKPNNYVGLLSSLLSSLPVDKPLREANIYTATDSGLVIDVFEFAGEKKPAKFNAKRFQERFKEISSEFIAFKHAIIDEPSLAAAAEVLAKHEQEDLLKLLLGFLSCSEQHYVLNTGTLSIIRHFHMVLQAMASESLVCWLEEASNSGKQSPSDSIYSEQNIFSMESYKPTQVEHDTQLIVVLPDFLDSDAFSRIVTHLSRLKIDILKAQLVKTEGFSVNTSNLDGIQDFLILTFSVKFDHSHDDKLSRRLSKEIKRLPYLDDQVLQLVSPTRFSLDEAELVVTFCRIAHTVLAEDKPLVFTQYHIDQFVKEQSELMKQVVELWKMKFAPLNQFAGIKSRLYSMKHEFLQIKQRIDKEIELEDCKVFFHLTLAVVFHALKTNWNLPDRRSLTILLDGRFYLEYRTVTENNLYAMFFCFGRGFHAYHLRFRDIARGGLKILESESMEQYAVSNRSLLTECFNLAIAQHLKNKDIPEGGAKAILLVEPGRAPPETAVKAFTDGILDLTCPIKTKIDGEEADIMMPDYSKGKELIYLGPDDKITDGMILWIAQRARKRGHPFPDAFMSSKPDTGISHGEFGVISESVVVFLDVAIRQILGRSNFTVKIVGGPHLDTPGKLIMVIRRYFAGNIKIVAVSDDSGVAEDPEGLNYDELERLISSRQSIDHYSPLKLSHKGHVISARNGNVSGIKARNSMPFRVESDVFIPADGRTYTINDYNWRQFIVDGRPASRIIVEGSNLFISPSARAGLASLHVLIIPDSSATKGGVICSSYEILAAMLLERSGESPSKLVEIRSPFISEVLDRLRYFCRLEGELLFHEYRRRGVNATSKDLRLFDVSSRISNQILGLKDLLYQSIMLDIYLLPVSPQQESRASDPLPVNSSVVENRSFYIESPSPSTSSSYREEHAESGMNSPVTLQDLSVDQIANRCQRLGFSYNHQYHKLCREILKEYVPPSLFSALIHSIESSSDFDVMTRWSIDNCLPASYRKRILATAIACKIVYKEGSSVLDELMNNNNLKAGLVLEGEDRSIESNTELVTAWSLDYLVELEKRRQLLHRIARVDSLEYEYKEQIAKLLEMGGFFQSKRLTS